MVEAALTERTNVNVHLVTEEDSAKNVIFFISPVTFLRAGVYDEARQSPFCSAVIPTPVILMRIELCNRE